MAAAYSVFRHAGTEVDFYLTRPEKSWLVSVINPVISLLFFSSLNFHVVLFPLETYLK